MLRNKKPIIIFAIICFATSIVFLMIPQSAHAITVEPLYSVLSTGPISDQIKSVWNNVLLLVNTLAAAALIFIAFANILRININNYGIKKFLPTLILTVIAANFSFLACRLLIDLANVACNLLIEGTKSPTATTATDISESTSAVSGAFNFVKVQVATFSDYPKVLMLAIMEFAGAICMLILAFLFFIRNYLIYFLVVLSPIAFVSLSLPQTKSAFNMWWSNFMKWTFLPIVSLFWLWVAGRWVNTLFTGTAAGSSSLLAYLFAGICYYLAITTPFKMGGTIMQQWGKAGKWGMDRTGVPAIGQYYKKKGGLTYQANRQRVLNTVKQYTGIGTGLDAAQARMDRVEDRRKSLSDIGKSRSSSSGGAQAEMQITENLKNTAKEINAASKRQFANSERGRELLTESLRIETRIATEEKDTNKILSDLKRDYLANAAPGATGANATFAHEVREYLRSNSDATVAGAEVTKSEKLLNNKLLADRMAYQNAKDGQTKAVDAHTAAVATGNPAVIAQTAAEVARKTAAVTAIETQIGAGTSWATAGHNMTDTEKSRSKVQLDVAIKEEAQAELEKDASTLQGEFFDSAYNDMFAQNPHAMADTDKKIEFLAKRHAVDKILSQRQAGRIAPEALSTARRLSTHLDGVGMDPTEQSRLIGNVVTKFNNNRSPGTTAMAAPSDFTGLANELDRLGAPGANQQDRQHASLLMTAMRSELTGNRPSERA